MTTILLVDDKKNIREFCKYELELRGYAVVLARDGQEATRAVRQSAPDLVILDVRMPRMNGPEAVERIKRIAPDMPVIFYTAHHEEYVRAGSSSAADACVQKSEDLSQLSEAIEMALIERARTAKSAAAEL